MSKRAGTIVCMAVILLSLAGITGCGKKAVSVEPTLMVQVMKIQPDKQAGSFSYAGQVRGRFETQVAFQTAGRIKERMVNNGDAVRAGQVLLRLDLNDLKNQLDGYRSQLAAAKAEYDLQALNYKRYQELSQQQVISKSAFDTAAAQYQVALARHQSAEAAFREAERQYGFGSLVAGADGIIADVRAEAGQVVAAGQAILTLVQSEEREVEINVPEQRVAEIRQVQRVNVTFWALPYLEQEGAVREVAAQADPATRTFKTRVALTKPSERILPGMSATVRVWTGQKPQIIVPVSAVYQTAGRPEIWLVEQETLKLQTVELGEFLADGVVVRSGIKEGDIIVTAGVHRLRAGQKVKIWDEAKP